MSMGINSGLNILQQSPHDLKARACGDSRQHAVVTEATHWIPSRYNIRAFGEDGSLVLWNTLSGSISVFEQARVPLLLKALKKKGFEASKKGTVKYLADRGFLVPEGANEYRQFQMKFGRQHHSSNVLELIIMPSEDCNFRCHYCYEDFIRGTMRPDVRMGIKKLVEDRAKYLDRLGISWFGGEPLYGWEAIEDLAPFFKDMADQHGLAFDGHMTTNGYLLTDEVAGKLLSWGITSYQITLDGAPEDHNKSRPARDGSETFDVIHSNLKEISLRDQEFNITIRVNFDQKNHVRLPGFLDLLEKDFANDSRFNLSFQAVSKWGGSNDKNLDTCGTKDGEKIMGDLVAAAKKRGLNLPSLKRANYFGGNVCYAARPYNFLIGAEGQLMKCTILLDKDKSNVVGRITPEGELELNDDKMALWTEPIFEKDTQCQKCLFLPSCGGAYCPLPRIQDGGKKCVPQRSQPKKFLLQLANESASGQREVVVST